MRMIYYDNIKTTYSTVVLGLSGDIKDAGGNIIVCKNLEFAVRVQAVVCDVLSYRLTLQSQHLDLHVACSVLHLWKRMGVNSKFLIRYFLCYYTQPLSGHGWVITSRSGSRYHLGTFFTFMKFSSPSRDQFFFFFRPSDSQSEEPDKNEWDIRIVNHGYSLWTNSYLSVNMPALILVAINSSCWNFSQIFEQRYNPNVLYF